MIEPLENEVEKENKKKLEKKKRKKDKCIVDEKKIDELKTKKKEMNDTLQDSVTKEKKKRKKDKKSVKEDKVNENYELPKKKKKKEMDSENINTTKSNKKIKETERDREQEGPFVKAFYKKTSNISKQDLSAFFSKHDIHVYGRGSEDIRPILTFTEMSSLDPRCMTCCLDFDIPTPIQSMTWPVVSSGRDVIGIAETGSGKTLAFSVPALAHVLHRLENPVKGICRSPMMLTLAPTRELAMQSQVVIEAAGKKCGIRSTCIYGGVAKSQQRKDLQSGIEVIVATPGRLLDLIEEGLCDLSGVSYVVLDEADRMLDQGFERAIRQILSLTHKNRQTCLFSATWPDSIRELAHEFLNDPIKVTIGSEDLAASKSVTQIVEVVEERSRDTKVNVLLRKYHINKNRILIFVLYKKEADRLYQALLKNGWCCGSIHGDRSQEARIQAVKDFKEGKVPLLIATDVAARGLDIPNVEYVINYSFPLTIEDYVHRIGRTGRAGKTGIAHTFFHDGDKARAGELVNLLKESNQIVPKEMYKFDLSVKRKEHKLYGSFGPKTHDADLMQKKATRIVFD